MKASPTEANLAKLRTGIAEFIDIVNQAPKPLTGDYEQKKFEAHKKAVAAHEAKQDEWISNRAPGMAAALFEVVGAFFVNIEHIADAAQK